MAVKIQPSFTTGELDPALHERTNIDKYKSGMATARNVIIGKTGRVMSRPGRRWFKECKTAGKKVRIFPLGHIGSFLEWGDLYVREYSLDGTLIATTVHTFTEANLDDIKFVLAKNNIVIAFLDGSTPLYYQTAGVGLVTEANFLKVPGELTMSPGDELGTDWVGNYFATVVAEGEEGTITYIPLDTLARPVSYATRNTWTILIEAADIPSGNTTATSVNEVKVYVAPVKGGVPGFIGTASFPVASGPNAVCDFMDYGQTPDFAHQPIQLNPSLLLGVYETQAALTAQAAVMYQQRLIVAQNDLLITSRTGFPGNFFRSYPLSSDSSLSLQVPGQGLGTVLHMIDSDGLIVFTSKGVYFHRGAMSHLNLTLDRLGAWIIDEQVPPIAIPGGVLFIDSSTNTVRQLLFSTEEESYVAPELSIFSDHLFHGNKVKSWSFQDGQFPLLWVTFTDGTLASFTYERSHKMRAWTRHDSVTDVEYVMAIPGGINQTTGLRELPSVAFVCKVGTKRHIEFGVPRYVSAAIAEADAQSDKNESIAALDAMVSWSHLINDDIASTTITVTADVADTWDGDLTLTATNAIFTTTGLGMGTVGTVFRYYDSDKISYDLTITARASDTVVTVSPNIEFPSADAANPRLWEAKATFTGLDHMEGESVAIVRDGFIAASPNNSKESYTAVTVASGSITLPDSKLGSHVHIGRPFVSDIETLDIDTVEQRPVTNESMTVNKLYIKVYRTRGFYVSSRFPADDTLDGLDITDMHTVDMGDIHNLSADYEAANPIVGERYDQPVTKRVETTLPGDWNSQGRICIRNVDPIHFEILSIMPDLSDIKRYNRRGEEL
jgi:hypothetical protein